MSTSDTQPNRPLGTDVDGRTIIKPGAVERIKEREAFRDRALDPFLAAYWTAGGTYVIVNRDEQTEDGRMHDLLAVVASFSGLTIVPLRPTVNPALVIEVARIVGGTAVSLA